MPKSPVAVLLLAAAACGGTRTDQNAGVSSVNPAAIAKAAGPAANQKGTGLILHSVTGLTVPVIGALGQLGTVDIDQAVITNFAVIENTVGQIVGVQADGVLQLTAGLLGSNVVTQDFSTTVSVTSSGPGQCNLVTIDLGPLNIDALGIATIDVPAATLTGKGSGAVGSLLCNLGNLLSSVTGTISSGVGGLVNALNNLI